MEPSETELYLKVFIQKQEMLLHEYMRKSIDSDIRASLLEAKVKEALDKYEESQKQVEIQNNMMSQAAKGLEAVTIENNELQEKLERYQKTLASVQQEKDTYFNDLTKLKESSSGSDKRVNEIILEMKKQSAELTALYNENESLKKKLPKPPPELNKKIKKDLPVTLPPDEF